MEGREYDPAMTVSNTGPDKSQPEPLWHVKTRTDARGLRFFEVGTRDGSHYITVSGNQRWMSRSEPAATRLAAKANAVLNEAVLEAGQIEQDPEPQPGDGPDYHAEHAAWRQRNPKAPISETGERP